MIRLMSCLVGAVAALVSAAVVVDARVTSPSVPAPRVSPVALQPSPPAVPTPAVRTVRYGATVLRVEDGDTVVVRLRTGQTWYVRVLGIDTHEVLFGAHECGGAAGSRSMHRMLPRGTRVLLRADPAQVRVDRYRRLLRYVHRASDGLDVGRAQLVRGLAEVYVHGDGAFARRTAYERMEHTARQRRLGIWRWC